MNKRHTINTLSEGIPEDLLNDLYLGYNLMKNEKERVSKLKLRSLLFNFAFYKSSPEEINNFINSTFPKQDDYSFEDFQTLVFMKYHTLKEREKEDTWNFMSSFSNNTSRQSIGTKEIKKAFMSTNIDISDKELYEMVDFINHTSYSSNDNKDNDYNNFISKDNFKLFNN